MADIVVRKMEERDLDEVASIEAAAFSIPWTRKSIKEAMETPENVYVVCTVDGVVAGYCGMWTVLGEGNITNVAVAPEYRRQGIADRIMDEVERRGKEIPLDIFFLEVRKSNEAAHNLYLKHGFRDIGVRKNFYEKPVEDANVMSKTFFTTKNSQ